MGAASSSLSVHHPGLWFQLPRNWKFLAQPSPIQESQIPGTSDLAGCRGNPKPMGPGCGSEGDSCLGAGGRGAVSYTGSGSEEQAHSPSSANLFQC